MISAGDLRKGTTFENEGQVYTVIDFLHVKPGKGAAFVRTKLRNVISGSVTETTFNPSAKFQEAVIERKEMQYLYSDGELYYFMDQETFEQIPLNQEKVEEAIKFLKPDTKGSVDLDDYDFGEDEDDTDEEMETEEADE